MANIKAAQSGNWSDTSTWQGGVLPGLDDIAIANSYTVTIDQDISVQTLSNSTFGSSTAGGFFQITTVGAGVTRNINLSLGLGNAATTYVGTTTGLLRISATSGTIDFGSANITGGSVTSRPVLIVIGSNITVKTTGNASASVTSSNAIQISNLAVNVTLIVNDVTVFGIVLAAQRSTFICNNITGGSANSSYGLFISGRYCVIEANTVTGGSSAGESGTIIVQSVGNALSIKNLIGGTGLGALALSYSFYTNNILKVENVYAGAAPAISLTNLNNDFMLFVVTGEVVASSTANAIVNTNVPNAEFRFLGPLIDTPERKAVRCLKFTLTGEAGSLTSISTYDSTGAPITLSNYHPDSPAPSNVRKGVLYGPNNQLTGAMSVPAPQSVSLGVPVDGTVGSAVLSGEDVLNSEIAPNVAIKTRINNIATVSSTGEQLKAALTSST
jgi:hypothetical protein